MSSALTVVGIAECAISASPEAVLATCALGSCIAVAVWDVESFVGGLLQFMLPESGAGTARGNDNPFVYADTGIPAMVQIFREMGGHPARMITRAVGGAQVMNDSAVCRTGSRNVAVLRRALAAAGLRLNGEALGGSVSRSVRLEVGTGRMFVRTGSSPGVERQRPPSCERKRICL